MAFDVNGARAAGWTDPEILAFMRKPLRKMALSTPGDWSPVGRAPVTRPQPFVGPRTPMNVPPPESTFQGTMERSTAPSYSGPQYTGGPLQIGQPPDVGNLISGIENVQGHGPQRAYGVSELGRFGMEAASPLLGPAAAARPLSTLMGLGYGMAAQHGVESGFTSLGVQPGYAQLAGDVAGFGAGVATGLAPWERFAKPGAFPEFVRNELGEIVIRPSQGWTSTLRDLIEQKVPAKVQPAQLRGILSQASPEEVKWSGLNAFEEQWAKPPFVKADVLGTMQQPEITEILHTPPDTKYGKWTLPGGEQSHELVFQLTKPNVGRYETGHYSHITNPIAHTRFNERTTPAGEPVLFLEEVQSDWHQQGRKQGYQSSDYRDQLLAANKAAKDAYAELVRTNQAYGPGDERTRSAQDTYEELERRSVEMRSSGAVPEAPFKKDWHELVMKRMISEAIAKGSKKLAWATGEQQAEHYNLSKHVDRIEYNPYSRFLEAWDPQGKQVVSQEGVEPNALSDYIGQDVAKKMHDQIAEYKSQMDDITNYEIEYDPDQHMHIVRNTAERMGSIPFLTRADAERGVRLMIRDNNLRIDNPSLSGLDLKTGGEGMKGFYDKILPDFARKYGKKFGSTVSQTQIQTPEGPKTVHSLDITPEMVNALKGGQPMFGTQIAKTKK